MVINSSYKTGFEGIAKFIIGTLVLLWMSANLVNQVEAAPKFAAIAVDARTGKILYAKNADAKRYPASLTKIMTLYLVFEDLRAKRITMNTRLRVSRYAAARPPSKLGFKPGKTIRVRDAIRALVTKSANDVATAIAENLGGSESGFARRMTRTAHAIGMTRTTFRNASGLPNSSQTTTARDMATLGLRLQRDFPRYYKFFAIKRFTYRGRRYGNHNRLLGRIKGVDGIKTGYTRASGFNLTSSARRGKKRIVAVVMGGRTGGARNRYMAALIKRMFAKKRLTRSTRIASTAGSPPGYKRMQRTIRLASRAAKKRYIPLPKKKPLHIAQIQAQDVVLKPSGNKTQPTPVLKTVRKPLPIKKQQDRLIAAVPVSTFKTVNIVDGDDDQPEILEFDGSKKALTVRKADKSDLIIPKRVLIRRQAKITDRILPDAQSAENQLTGDQLVGNQPVGNQPVGSQPVRSQPIGSQPVGSQPAKQLLAKAKPVTAQLVANQHTNSWNIQIGAFPSKKSATGRLAKASKKARRNLNGKVAFTIEVRKNGSSFYRARFAGFNRQTAKRACRTLVKKGIGCFALAPRS